MDLRALALGSAIGLLATTGVAACDTFCSGERGDYRFAAAPYRYGFDVARAPFHDDGAVDIGTLDIDAPLDRVTVRYPIPAGEKVETWVIEHQERRGSDDPRY